jgi:hypothetical protein
MASHTSRSLLWALLSCLALAQTTDAFAPYSRTQRSNHALSRVFGTASPDGPRPNDSNSDFPPEEDSAAYKGDIDWDGEWKKVVAKQNMPQKRPGKDFYKSDAEIAAIRAANLATEQANKVASNIPQVPEWRSLQGDWKFWVGLLAIVSVGFSLLSAAGTQGGAPVIGTADSYYI